MGMIMVMAMVARRAEARPAPPTSRRTKSAPHWKVRGGIATVCLALAYVSTTQTLAYVIGKSDAERAHQLAPSDGRLAGALAEQIAVAGAGSKPRPGVTQLARQALDNEPLSMPALTALALNTQFSGNTAASRRLFMHSDALSRREFLARLWLIEDAVDRGDIAGALRHYDIGLRTERGAPPLLFPVLANGLTNPEIAKPLAATLFAHPPWGDAFVSQLGTAEVDPIARAEFMKRLSKGGYDIPEAAQFGVINALLSADRIDDAWTLYSSLRPGARRDRSRDFDFRSQLQTPTAFDWTAVTNDTGVSASIQGSSSGGNFEFSTPSTVGGVILQQTQALPPGQYMLKGTSSNINQPLSSRPYWQLVCGDGRNAGQIDIPNSTSNGGQFSGNLTVSTNCKVQTLRLVVRPSSSIEGVSGRLERVMLIPNNQLQ